MIKKIDQQSFNKALQTKNKPAIVNFTTDWWSHYKQFMIVIEEIATEYANKIKMYPTNIDNHPDTAEKYNIMTAPTIIVFQNDKITNSTVNPITKETVLELIFKEVAQ